MSVILRNGSVVILRSGSVKNKYIYNSLINLLSFHSTLFFCKRKLQIACCYEMRISMYPVNSILAGHSTVDKNTPYDWRTTLQTFGLDAVKTRIYHRKNRKKFGILLFLSYKI